MKKAKQTITRRDAIKCSLGGAALALVTPGCGNTSESTDAETPEKFEFYKADGAFDPEAAKKAYFAMMKSFGYPITDTLGTEDFWVCDFMQREYDQLGMGGIFFINAKGTYGTNGEGAYSGDFEDDLYGYLGHEIYLLPGQMLPEHRHIGGAEGYGPKMESWQVRYGSVEFFGEYQGEGTETLISDMPEQDRPWGFGQDWFKSKYIIQRTAQSGKLYTLEDPQSWHGQRAGAEGAIVTEYATYHNHVEFSKPDMEFASSEAT